MASDRAAAHILMPGGLKSALADSNFYIKMFTGYRSPSDRSHLPEAEVRAAEWEELAAPLESLFKTCWCFFLLQIY